MADTASHAPVLMLPNSRYESAVITPCPTQAVQVTLADQRKKATAEFGQPVGAVIWSMVCRSSLLPCSYRASGAGEWAAAGPFIRWLS